MIDQIYALIFKWFELVMVGFVVIKKGEIVEVDEPQ